MFNKALNTAVVALAATRFASAQTFTDCDPTEKCACSQPLQLATLVLTVHSLPR